jgi:predicted S18 family serine protease
MLFLLVRTNRRRFEMKLLINQPRLAITATVFFSLMVLGGCMSSGPKPDVEISQAKTAVDQADRAGTRSYAAYDLTLAKDKLKKAKKEMKEGDYKEAKFLANEAKVDAELAEAKTQTAKTKEAEAELKKSMQSLEKEVNQSTTSPQ